MLLGIPIAVLSNDYQIRALFGKAKTYSLLVADVLRIHLLKGYLTDEKHSPRRTLQLPYGQGPLVILGGWVFLTSEVPLYAQKGLLVMLKGKKEKEK